MRRQIFEHKRQKHINGCCPGHDDWPSETYRSRRSKHARARDIKHEHKVARHLSNRVLDKEIHSYEERT